MPYRQRVAAPIFEFTAFLQADQNDLEPFLAGRSAIRQLL